MPRLEPPAASEMDEAQRRVHDLIAKGPRGKVEGPLGIWLHSPGLAELAQALGAFCRFHSSLPPRLSELAIITCGAIWRAGFEWAVHAPVAISAGIDPALVEAIRKGEVPLFVNPEEEIVYRFVKELCENRSVGEKTYTETEKLITLIQLIDLVGIVGYYSFICMKINVFEVPVPDGQEFPFGNNE